MSPNVVLAIAVSIALGMFLVLLLVVLDYWRHDRR